MPIDPSIPLGFKSPTFINPLDVQSKQAELDATQARTEMTQAETQNQNLQAQQTQLNMQAQKDLSSALQKHSKISDDGTLSTDWASVQRDLASNGHGAEALKIDEQRRKALSDAFDMEQKKNQIAHTKLSALGSLAGSVSPVTSQDPAVRPAQVATWQSSVKNAVTQAVALGDMSPQQGQAYIARAAQGYDPSLDAEFKQFQTQALSVADQLKAHNEDLKDGQQLALGNITLGQHQLQKFAQDFTASGVKDQAGYDALLASHPEVKDKVSSTYGDNTARDVQRAGMSPHEAAQADETATRDKNTETRQRNQESLERMRVNLDQQRFNLEKSNSDKKTGDGMTGNGRGVSYRYDMKSLGELVNQEQQLNSLRSKLYVGSTKPGTVYYDDKGKPTDISQKDQAVRDAFVADMTGRHQEITDKLVDIAAAKNDILSHLGKTARVTPDQVRAALQKTSLPGNKVSDPVLVKPGESEQAPAPAQSPATQTPAKPPVTHRIPAVGQPVKLKTGETVIVKSVDPKTGKFTY